MVTGVAVHLLSLQLVMVTTVVLISATVSQGTVVVTVSPPEVVTITLLVSYPVPVDAGQTVVYSVHTWQTGAISVVYVVK